MKFMKDWMLVVAMVAGAGAYLIYHNIPALHSAGPVLEMICRKVQPVLLFSMLFLSFCRIEPRQLRPHKWQAWLLLIQGGSFVLIAGALLLAARSDSAAAEWIIAHSIALQSAMLCLICPTATACAVVTGELGGDMAGAVSYTVLINLLVALLVPLVFPLISPISGLTFFAAFWKILFKVFPLLILPCICAWLVRRFLPKAHAVLAAHTHIAFYIWASALTLAILMSTRAIVRSDCGLWLLLEIAIVSLLCCIFQFWAGKRVGSRYGHKITAGQSLGQKNTVFSIWMGYTFLDPLTSIAGGFYSVWHNIYNTWQLSHQKKAADLSSRSHDADSVNIT